MSLKFLPSRPFRPSINWHIQGWGCFDPSIPSSSSLRPRQRFYFYYWKWEEKCPALRLCCFQTKRESRLFPFNAGKIKFFEIRGEFKKKLEKTRLFPSCLSHSEPESLRSWNKKSSLKLYGREREKTGLGEIGEGGVWWPEGTLVLWNKSGCGAVG